MSILQQLPKWLQLDLVVKGLVVLVIGFIAAQALGALARKAALRRSDHHSAMLIGKVVYYACAVLVVVLVLDIFNVRLTAILAAAGIMSVALGFAAQTSVSNIVSGLFLLIDRPFELDDVIDLGGTVGTVTAIDLLSTKLRTFDNLYVRVPNETLVKSTLVNLTRYKTRRLKLSFAVDPRADVAAVKQLLLDEARGYQHVLADPGPFVVVAGFGESGAALDLFCWVKGEAYLQSLSDLNERARAALAKRGIAIACPRRMILKDE
ncbi:MAG TPA: mechanosensitive ion channel family protein [Candidatus Edwardsbacteria bacterium]|nr:mechanosensitive ion channel family protein [Candidatus Edwardsbacteria bacterium]